MSRPALVTVVLLLFVALGSTHRGPDKGRRQEHSRETQGHHDHRHVGQQNPHSPTDLDKRLKNHETHYQGLHCSYDHLEKYVATLSEFMHNKFGEGTPLYVPLKESSSCHEVAEDCSKVKAAQPSAQSGVFMIRPRGASSAFQALCSFEDDGAWTVIQHRFDGSVPFTKNWVGYKNGFGSPEGEHWLGLEKMHALTSQGGNTYALRIEVDDFEGEKRSADYDSFRVDGESDGYALHVGAYSGTAGDSIRGERPGEDQNGRKFSTIDKDNDGCNPCIFGDIAVDSCSRNYEEAGWWYSNCGSADLNGNWHPKGSHIGWASMLRWRSFSKIPPYSMKSSVMKIKLL